MNKINRQHLNEYLHYLITESNIVQTIFDDAIYDVVNIIRETIHQDYIKCNELNYTGWCYDNVNLKGFVGNPELLLFQQYEDLHPVVQELCNAYTKLYETDELQHHLMNEGEIRIGNNVY